MNFEEKIAEVKAKNLKLNGELTSLIENRADIDRQIGALKEEAARQQGEYRMLESLIAESKNETTH
jgi:chorismate mutase